MAWNTKNTTLLLASFIVAQVVFITIFLSLHSPEPSSPISSTPLPCPTLPPPSTSPQQSTMTLLTFDQRPLPTPDDMRTHLCLRQSGLAPAGGIETWFWTMVSHVFSKAPLSLYSLTLIRSHWLHAWFFGSESIVKVLTKQVKLNLDERALNEECDVVITTGTEPLPPHPAVPNILLIHGSGDEWTRKYTRYINYYDAVVCVSRGCTQHYTSQAESLGIPLYTVPSAVNPDECKENHAPRSDMRAKWRVPDGKRVLGFLGRISHEKNPKYFVEVMGKMPPDWVGIMAGPIYFEGEMPELNDRTTYVGYENACDFLAAVDAILLPSELEGGPIVLLEAWAMRVPFFMRLTGLAIAHSEAVQIIGTYSTETVKQIVDFMDPSAAVEREAFMDKGASVLHQKYTTDVVHNLWKEVVETSIQLKLAKSHTWRAPLIPIHMPEGNTEAVFRADDFQVELLGHAAGIRCFAKDECEAHINFPLPYAFELSFTPKYLVMEYRATTLENHPSAGTVSVSSASPGFPYQQNQQLVLSTLNSNSLLCLPLPDTLPSKLETKFLVHNQVTMKVIDISITDDILNRCSDASKHTNAKRYSNSTAQENT